MPSNQNPLGALPARFRRQRVLIVGCGDVGLRAAKLLLHPRLQVLALTSDPERAPELRAAGIKPLLGNLDFPSTLTRLAGLSPRVIHLAPPPSEGQTDRRTQALVRALRRRELPAALVYGSTSGVYGHCGGEWVNETRAVNPQTPRARRRVDAEAEVRFLGRAGVRTSILRIPGIYAPDREGGTPRERLRKGTPVLLAEEDVFTNHIHANDLARACVLALWRGRPLRAINVSDDTDLRIGDYMDFAADLYGVPRPPRITLAQATQTLSPMQLSFMRESRRLDNQRMKRELRMRLAYPTVRQGLIR
ncbi:SDR family oxidoreductase [Ottowia sp. VDI28]|uniref:SDR family oxidoreductase n=1 Tax=Ottowia sp. VDI28 TaxID=3133968 RepID=UPI003C2FB63B